MKKYSLTFNPKASDDYSDAFWFYENSRTGLGSDFENEVEKILSQIRIIHFFFTGDLSDFVRRI